MSGLTAKVSEKTFEVLEGFFPETLKNLPEETENSSRDEKSRCRQNSAVTFYMLFYLQLYSLSVFTKSAYFSRLFTFPRILLDDR